jgi:intein/homing endonuclease
MADGTTKPIADVRVGDYVAAFDGLGALTPRRVTNIFSYEDREVVELNEVRVTSEHRFLLANGMYKRVNELVEGDVLVATDGSFVPEWSVVPIAGTYTVHNLTVEGTHTYVAGGFRVHNIK